jgi:hypothetical protein
MIVCLLSHEILKKKLWNKINDKKHNGNRGDNGDYMDCYMSIDGGQIYDDIDFEYEWSESVNYSIEHRKCNDVDDVD